MGGEKKRSLKEEIGRKKTERGVGKKKSSWDLVWVGRRRREC